MINLYIIFTTLFSFVLLSSSAQEYTVEWGPLYKKEGGITSKIYVVGYDDNQYYLAAKPKKEFTLLAYDYEHNLNSSKEHSFTHNGKKLATGNMFETRKYRYITLYANPNNSRTKKKYYASFNEGKFGMAKDAGDLTSGLGFIKYQQYIGNSVANSNTVCSMDKSHLARVLAYSTESESNPDKVAVIVHNENIEPIWQATHTLPFPDQKLEIMDAVVTNTGSVYLTGKLYQDNQDREKGIPNYRYQIIQLSKEEIVSYTFELGDTTVVPRDAKLFVSDNAQSAYLGGFYTKREKRSGINGVFIGEIDFSSGLVKGNYKAFSEEFLEGLVRDKAIEKGKGVSYSYSINHLVTFEDETFSFIAERSFTTTNYDRSTTRYHTNEIIIPRFEKDGTLVSLEKIEKEYFSEKERFTSYTFAFKNNKIYLVYNDSKTLSEKERIEKPVGHLARYTDMTIIGIDGLIESQKTLFNSKEIPTEFVPSFSFASEEGLIIGGLRPRGYQFGTLFFND